MNWILIVVIVLLAEKDINHMKLIFGLANPLPISGPARIINPYILHWEAANFDRITLENAHQYHLVEKNRRRKRDLKKEEYGPAHTIKLKFTAHDREFRLVLHQDPLSVFTPDAEIENTLGPVDYDISRIYTGSLEDDENSHIHAVLTTDNLIDGTISTMSEQYYIEPSNKYSKDLELISGIHSIVYKLSDVKMDKSISTSSPTIWLTANSAEHCASEKLRNKLLLQKNDYKRRKKLKSLEFIKKNNSNNNNNNNNSISHKRNDISDISNNKNVTANSSNKDNRNLINSTIIGDNNIKNSYDEHNLKDDDDLSLTHNRHKRWLPDELSDNRDPPLPLDLDVPYNDDYSVYNRNINQDGPNNKRSGNNKSTNSDSSTNSYKPNNNFGHTSSSSSSSSSNSDVINGNGGIYTKNGINRNRNILINQYNPNDSNNNNNQNSDLNYNLNINGRNNLFTSYNYNNNNNNNNRNIIVNSYNNSINTNYRNLFNTNLNNTDINSNSGSSSSSSRPSHKTHVEIITKNGATKKPNIIVNNYNPDIIHTINQNNNNNDQINNFINHMNNHLNLNIRNELTDTIQSTTSTTNSNHNTNNNNNNIRSSYDRKSTCMLYLQADHTFFQKMGSDEASIEAITRHVQRANSIYKNTDFNGDGKPDNITFMIKRIKVHNSNALKDPTYRFPGNYGVEKFLELFSEEDYDAFCLAYMFTYRDFEMGTLGLAWTGDLKNAGGVCEKNGHYRGSLKSLNTGIVTLLNYGKHVPPAVSHVTLAHEIGHNFGSPHDPEQCTPGGEDGNYIMFARATSGDKRNNNKFSPCSLKSIEPVLNAKARSAKGCFTEPQTSICGNGVVEPGEQCDCGWEEDCKDDCCFPMSRHPRTDEKPCTLLPRAICSPSQGPCCTNQCSLKFGDKCRDDNGCRDPSFCDGRMPHCPPSVNKPNKTICNKEFVCYMGDCTGSICLAYGLESCQCLPGPTDPKTKSCELCCKEPGEGKHCKSSFEWNEPPFDVPDMFAKPGTPCNDYNGYCDVFQKCREVDPSGPLATLRKLLLSEESIASFKKWIQSNWYTVVLAAIGVVILLVLSTKLLGKRNVKLKSVTIIHSATTETVRLPEDNNGVIVHTAVRTKVPFKKKVRGQRSTKPSTKIITKKSTKQIIKSGNNSGTGGSSSNNNNNGSNGHTPTTTNQTNNGITQGTTATMIIPKTPKKRTNSSTDVLKKVSHKKNRISSPSGDENTTKILKKPKKNKKHKEIIDYSKTSSGTGNVTNHTNTFGKVQKWLLDSPIVSQPLSHIEHSSKVRKVISKSQSTPERLAQKSPQKTKSVGNLSNDKVKLQVVYKPPFKFSLKLSKNSTVKTHVIGGALNKSKRKIRSGEKRRSSGAVGPLPIATTTGAIGKISNSIAGERGRRTALLLRTNSEDDSQHLVNLVENSEPNYETLNSKLINSDKNPLYENMHMKNNAIADNVEDNKFDNGINEPSKPISIDAFRINRSASNSHIEKTDQNRKNKNHNSYNRSNSVSHNPFNNASSIKQSLRKSSDMSMNLNRNFGSTQNLISSNGNLSKSKKRSSLNLKSSSAVNNNGNNSFQNSTSAPTKYNNSNLNIKRENSTTNLRRDIDDDCVAGVGSSTNLMKSTSINRIPSINNIPRASLTGHRTPTPPNMILTRQHSAINPSSITNNDLGNNQIINNYSNSSGNNSSNSSSNSFRNSKNIIRPYTAACDDTTRQFEWPTKSTNLSTTQQTNNLISYPINNISGINAINSSTTNLTKTTTNSNDQITTNSNNKNNKFNLSNKIINRNLSKNEEESLLPLNLEVMVSDIENLVS